LLLGGVEIPHSSGLDGHSDADVLSHAIADALLGAIGENDIGHHFPNTDEAIRGISSIAILERVAEVLRGKGAEPVNVDATLIAEAPKIAPYIPAMRAQIAAALRLPPERVSIKATTNEGLGTIGRGEGMCAMAVASVEMN
jgi:2-C-methyl-D-erythritol 2,4-cyclodiphosphate synthase